jgi:hypothetical protein
MTDNGSDDEVNSHTWEHTILNDEQARLTATNLSTMY